MVDGKIIIFGVETGSYGEVCLDIVGDFDIVIGGAGIFPRIV